DELSEEEKEMYKSYLSNEDNEKNTHKEIKEEISDNTIEENKEEEITDNQKKTEEEEIINNEEDLSEEDKAMFEGYLDKADGQDENELSEEEKEMYKSYLSNEDNNEENNENNKENKYHQEDTAEEITEEELENLVYINNVQIDEIKDSDLNMLEKIISGDDENGIELIPINNKTNKNDIQEDNVKVKSLEHFDSIDELLKKETNMSEEKELKTIEKENLDDSVAVEEEFSLGDDNDHILMEEKENKLTDDDEDFDGEITQSDLDHAVKLFESEESYENDNAYSSKQDLLLSENEINKFKKLFGYFKNIVEKMSPQDLNDFSKTEFYDMYSSLFRKFGD
ncbi:hypothetical protein, partial [uncultured Brachyspira sp.]|uniref:hypothetical protein n=1 Tax=uncultured Brachyspira sp. TaxID=221953 RepID=UPI0025CE6882